jgi:hypothetical protein
MEDSDFRSFVLDESEFICQNKKNIQKLKESKFFKIIALAQYGHLHELSLHAAIKRNYSEIRYLKEVTEQYPFIQMWSATYHVSSRVVILALLISILYENQESILNRHAR